MPTLMDAMSSIVGGIAAIGEAASLTATDLKEAVNEAKNYTAAVEEAKNSTYTMTGGGGSSPTDLSAALKAQTGRR